MIIPNEELPFVKQFVNSLDEGLQKNNPGSKLTSTQKMWLAFCITAIILSNTVCWKKFERIGLGKYKLAALSWMFRNSMIPWELLLVISVRLILKRFGITEGILVIDDTQKKRSKNAKKIACIHKLKDASTGGFIMGQSIVFLLLVTPLITIPVGFAFFMPDPEMTEWRKKNEKQKKQGVPAKKRPKQPAKNLNYPTKYDIAVRLLEMFAENHPDIKVKCVQADALYGKKTFMKRVSVMFGGVQVISQLQKTQNIVSKNIKKPIKKFCDHTSPVRTKIKLRGGKEVTILMVSARLFVSAHETKRFVIGLKYEGESEYRYLVATDMTWRAMDIIQAYTLRWLVEVFIQDWKSYEGWGQLTKQTGTDGSSRSLILSLLVDHCLFFHPDQTAQLDNKLPAYTVGSLRDRIKGECLHMFIHEIFLSKNPKKYIDSLVTILKKNVFELRVSDKHMAGKDQGRLEASLSLKYRALG